MPVDLCAALTIVQVVLRLRPSTRAWSSSATMAATNSRQSLMFHPAAFAFAMVDLPDKLAGANAKTVGDADTKIAMRWVEQYNIQTDQSPSRCDTIGGVASILPYFAVRMWS